MIVLLSVQFANFSTVGLASRSEDSRPYRDENKTVRQHSDLVSPVRDVTGERRYEIGFVKFALNEAALPAARNFGVLSLLFMAVMNHCAFCFFRYGKRCLCYV